VELSGLNLNQHLVRVLREWPASVPPMPINPLDLSHQRRRKWKIRDRFIEDEIAQIVMAFKAGTPKHALAEQYGMNLRSLKKLLRAAGMSLTESFPTLASCFVASRLCLSESRRYAASTSAWLCWHTKLDLSLNVALRHSHIPRRSPR
jgi:hypothetical protein